MFCIKQALQAGALLSCAFAGPVMAQQAGEVPAVDTGFGFVLEGAFEFGGDSVATVYFEDGSDQDVDAGQGITLGGGVHHRWQSLDLRGTLGYKFVTTKASNADIMLTRLAWEVVADWYFTPDWFIGAGVAHHTGIEYDADGLGPNLAFDDATGITAELGWKWISVSYTDIEYTDEFGFDYDASNFGAAFTWRF